LQGHVARSNPLWKEALAGGEALAIFHGPNRYISPSWYATKKETGKVVPTWNYVAVHAYGTLRPIEDRAWLRALVERLTVQNESVNPDPWKVSDAPEDYVEKMLEAIVGVEIAITRLEGKWKVSQNQPAANRASVVKVLRESGGEDDALMADLIADAAKSSS
jgi:transcriptional regulator